MSAGETFTDYYQLLGVEIDSSPGEIKRAYLKLAKETHPDTGGDTERMQLLNQAYRTLTDEIKRKAYDKLYSLENGNYRDGLDLQEESADISSSPTTSTGLEDAFVDQVYSEYYSEKKPKKKGPFSKLFK